MILYEEYTLETVDGYSYYTSSFSYSELKVQNKRQELVILVDDKPVYEYDISLDINALGNVSTIVTFDYKVEANVVVQVYNYVKQKSTDYEAVVDSEFELLHDFDCADKNQRHFHHVFLNGQSNNSNKICYKSTVDNNLPVKNHYVDIVKHKGYSQDTKFYWAVLHDVEPNFFFDYPDAELEYQHKFLLEGKTAALLVPAGKQEDELPTKFYEYEDLFIKKRKRIVKSKKEYPDLDVFILQLGNIDIEPSIYKTFPDAQVIKDRTFSGAIKNAVAKSSTEHFITVEANFRMYESWRGYKRIDVFEDTENETYVDDKRIAKIQWPGPHIWCSGQGLHRGVVLWPKNFLEEYEVNDSELEQFELQNVKLMPDAAGEFNEDYSIFILQPEDYYQNNAEQLQSKIKGSVIVYGKTLDECYANARDRAKSDYFWCVNADVIVNDDFKFEYTPDLYRRNHVHVWQKTNPVSNLPYIYDGVKLIPREYALAVKDTDKGNNYSKNTFGKLFNVKRARACKDVPFDVVMLTYFEPNADENFENLCKIVPNAMRVDGVKGIMNAHKAAAEKVSTKMLYVVDGDAQITPNFKFDYYPDVWEEDIVHVWRSKNPINGLVYGYGGVKMFPTQPLRDATKWNIDFTTSVSTKFKAVQVISNITAFNTDEWNTWKAAFRECAKLASNIIERGKNDENEKRLEAWRTMGHDRPFGEYALAGATAGMEYGLSCGPDELNNINDFDWLKERFNGNT